MRGHDRSPLIGIDRCMVCLPGMTGDPFDPVDVCYRNPVANPALAIPTMADRDW
ncbi:MAG: hypothetical protein M3457_04525 [Chloroflexota bacterium]|nr:hypothetical protein [Chloroflexota bacterium]